VPHDTRTEDALKLLRLLEEWDVGPLPAGQGVLKSTGESNSRIEDLEAQLAALGARYRRRGGKFVLEGFAERGRGERLPDQSGEGNQ
jgi:hypothetical protein